MSFFLDFHLKPLAQKVKSYIQDSPLADDLVLCKILYLNIPHEEGLKAIRKALHTKKDKTECVLKNNIFEHDKSVFKQL